MLEINWQRVYWLCGSPCAGKTTIAQRLAARFDWQIYACDDWFDNHRTRSTPAEHPTFHRISHLRGDALWLRPVAEQIAAEVPLFEEQFKLVLEDLALLLQQTTQPLLFEGAAALPHQLQARIPNKQHAFWLIPTERFQLHYYAQRPWIHAVLAETSAPQQAFANWMGRDAGLARWLEEQLVEQAMPGLVVDGSLTIEETFALVAAHFQGGVSPQRA